MNVVQLKLNPLTKIADTDKTACWWEKQGRFQEICGNGISKSQSVKNVEASSRRFIKTESREPLLKFKK